MDSENTTQAGPGCLPWLLIAAGLLLTLALFGVDDDGHNMRTTTSTYKVEAFSRNQGNLFSDVTNEFYDCSGPWSCTTVVSTTATSNQTTQTTSTNLDVGGDRNVIASPWGEPMCWDDAVKTHTTSACKAQGVTQ